MQFVTTPEFDDEYGKVPEDDWDPLDANLKKLLADPTVA